MRILQVITDTDRRGAQVFATDLHAALERRGHEVQTVALAPGAGHPALQVPVLGRRPRGWSTLRTLRSLARESDITVAHGSTTALACAIAARPFVYRQVSDTTVWAASAGRQWRVRRYLMRADTVVALSMETAQVLSSHLGIPSEHIEVIPNGVDVGRFGPASESERNQARARWGVPPELVLGVVVGALVPEKGVEVAIRAIAALPQVGLLVVGEGPERPALGSLAEAVAPGRVWFAGGVHDVRLALAAADLAVMPSLTESMPAVLIEVGLMGLAAVSTDVGAVGDIVVDHETGWLVTAGDLEGLRAAVDALVGDQAARLALGSAARVRCLERFDIDLIARSWETLLIDAVAASTRAR